MNSGAACARIYWARGLFGILKTAQNHLKRKQLESAPNCFPIVSNSLAREPLMLRIRRTYQWGKIPLLISN